MDTSVSHKVKDEMSIIRLQNTLGLYHQALKEKGVNELSKKEFAEYIGVTPEYWLLITNGHRNFSKEKARLIEKRLNLSNGELDLSPDMINTVPALLIKCANAFSERMIKAGKKTSEEKAQKIIEKVYYSSLKLGAVNSEELDDLISLLP